MILTSLAIVGAFLLVFGAFIAKDIVAARRSPHKISDIRQRKAFAPI